MKILTKPNGVVVAYSENVEVVDNGVLINGLTFIESDLVLIDIVDQLVPENPVERYVYTNNEFILNPDFIEETDN